MPIFEYQCRECGTKFEKIVSSPSGKVTCKNCASEKSLANCSPESQRRLSTSTIRAHGSTPPKPVRAIARKPRNNSESAGTGGLVIAAGGDSRMQRDHKDRRAVLQRSLEAHSFTANAPKELPPLFGVDRHNQDRGGNGATITTIGSLR